MIPYSSGKVRSPISCYITTESDSSSLSQSFLEAFLVRLDRLKNATNLSAAMKVCIHPPLQFQRLPIFLL